MPPWHNLVLRKTGNLVSVRISQFKQKTEFLKKENLRFFGNLGGGVFSQDHLGAE